MVVIVCLVTCYDRFGRVRDNIANFGGDPAEVTIIGQSAGAASVATHMVSGPSKGLFKQAIMMSNPAVYRQVQHAPLAESPCV